MVGCASRVRAPTRAPHHRPAGRLRAPPRATGSRGSFEAPTAAQAQGWPAIAAGRAHAHLRADRQRQDAGRVPVVPRPAARGDAAPRPAATRCASSTSRRSRRSSTTSTATCGRRWRASRLAAERLGRPARPRSASACAPATRRPSERRAFGKRPPDILVTTPESLYLLLTSQAREALRGVRWVIVDEIHALAGTKRGAHLALSLERLEALADRPPQRIGLSATQRPLSAWRPTWAAGSRRAAAGRTARRRRAAPGDDRRCRRAQGARAPGRRAGRGHGPARRGHPARGGAGRPGRRPGRAHVASGRRSTRASWSSSGRTAARSSSPTAAASPSASRSTSTSWPARSWRRAHHGSLAREQRLLIEEQLKQGRLPAIVATSSLELGIDMGAVDLVIQVESPLSVARGLQRVGRAGHQVGEPSRGVIFPKYRGDLLETAVVTRLMHEGAIEPTVVPRNPLDVLAQQLVAMTARPRLAGGRALRDWSGGPRTTPSSAATPSRPRWACSPASIPADEFAELRAAGRLGPRGRHRPGAPRRAHGGGHVRAARSPTAASSPSTSPTTARRGTAPGTRARAARSGRPARRRARRGDGLRGARGRGRPARRQRLAHRVHRARPRPRDPGAGRARQGALLEGRRRRPAGRARPRPGRLHARDLGRWRRPARRGRRAGPAAAPASTTTSTSWRPPTCSPTSRRSTRPPAPCPPTGRSCCSASATSWATGASAC